MRIGQAVRDLDRQSGGPSRSVPALCVALSRADAIEHVQLWFQGSDDTIQLPEMAGLACRDTRVSPFATAGLHCLHLQGLWTPALHRIASQARRVDLPYVISPRGMLSEWCLTHKRWKKRLAYWLYQGKDLKRASAIHVTSGQERRDVAKLLPDANIVEVPNGCDVPTDLAPAEKSGRLKALVVCRLHPVKQLDMLVRLWCELSPEGWELEIAGPGEPEYVAHLKRLVETAENVAIRFTGEVDGVAKWEKLGAADLFILPSASENFGMSVAEAMAAATPVLTTDGTPWQELDAMGAGWTTGVDASSFRPTLASALKASREELRQKGLAAQLIIRDQYSWGQIATRMATLYQGVVV